nr:hypothetical protein [Tanacetum cinerariifolium]
IEEFNLDELSPPIVMIADQRIMAQLLQAPTEGYEDAIVVPAITADNFELKHGLLTLVQNKQFFRHDKEDPHAHIRHFNKITSTLKFPNVPNTSIKLMLFPFSLECAARIWLEKEPPLSIFTCEACDRFKDLLRACPHHGFLELRQLDTFYNALNSKDQDSLNSADGGTFLDKLPRECLAIIESKSKVRYSRNKPVVAKVSTNTSTFAYQAPAYQASAPQTQGVSKEKFLAYVKANDAVMRNMQTQGQNMQNQLTNLTELLTKFVNSNSTSTSSSGTLPSNTIANPKSELNTITTQSGVSYEGPQILPLPSFLPKVVENEPEATKDAVTPPKNESTEDVQPPVVQTETPIIQISKPVAEPIFKDMSFKISFADALILMPKFSSTLKALIKNKEKLSEMARTLLNEHCSVVLLKKFPEKLGDTGKFLIPCDFPGMDECLALADLGARINLMPWSVWKKLSLPELTPTYFDADPRVPLILMRSFLKTERALIDVFEGELTLRIGKEAITFYLDQTSRYSANYNDMTTNRIDVIDKACEEYSQEVLGFSDVIASRNPTPHYDLIVSTTSPTLTPFGNSDFLLEEVDAFLALEDDPTTPKVDQSYFDSEGDIPLLEAFLNNNPSPPPQGNYLP